MAAVSVFRVAVVLFFLRLSRADGGNGEPGLHVVGLVNKRSEAVPTFLHSACRLNHSNVQIVREWSSSKTSNGYKELETRLRNLPQDDLIILSDLRKEYTHIMARPKDVTAQVLRSGHSLILAPRPRQAGLKEAMEKQMEEALKEKEQRKGGGRKEDEEGKRREAEDKKKDKRREEKREKNRDESVLSTLNGGSVIGRVGAVLRNLEEEDKKEKKEKEDNMKEKEEKAKAGKTKEEQQGEEEKKSSEEEEKGKEGKMKEEDQEEEGQKIRRDEVTQSAFTDTKAEYVLFGGRQLGGMSISVPIRVEFTPIEAGEKTNPILLHLEEEKEELYNLVEAMGEGPPVCSFEVEEKEPKTPRVLVALLLAGSWSPFLEDVLEGLEGQEYPKDKIDVWIHVKPGLQEEEILAFKARNEGSYGTVEVSTVESIDMHFLRNKCEAVQCDFLAVMHASAFLEHPGILSSLISANRPMVGPLLVQRGTKEYNLEYTADTSPEWEKLIRRQKIRGIFKVRDVKYFSIIRKGSIESLANGKQIGTYVDTRVNAGTIVDPRGFKEGKKNPNLWGIKSNNYMWTRRYIHPQLIKIIKKEAKAEELAPYLYYVPFYTEKFCQELVEEMEAHGKWHDGETDNREIAHQYTSRNINLEQIDFDGEYYIILNSFHKELLATLYNDYRAYAEPSLIFVLKYADNTKYNTFKYHLDGATYTYNIALNNDFTGGGIEYRMGNRYFNEEEEFSVSHNKTGWAVIQPNRPLHVHRGVALESGTRYALINIIDTNDAGSKGGPTWVVS